MDWSGYQEVKVGEKSETVVKEVIEGKQEDFRTDKYFDNIEGSKEKIEQIRKSPALLVKCENGAEMVINAVQRSPHNSISWSYEVLNLSADIAEAVFS